MIRRRLRAVGPLQVAVLVAAATVFGNAGFAAAGTTTQNAAAAAAPPSQFTVAKGSIRAAKGSPVQPSGTEAVLWGATSSATTTIEGSGRVMIGAIGTYCEGWPTISVAADGVALGTATALSATNYDSYRLGQASRPAGTHNLTITYSNDFSNSNCDRNVAIGWAKMENPSTTTFTHPGIDVSRPQLDDIKAHVAAHDQPWFDAYTTMSKSRFAKLTYTPQPVDIVKCAGDGGRKYIAEHPEEGLAEQGCTAQTEDAIAAETHALMYSFTGNAAYAQKSIEIMNAWSHKLTAIWFDQPRRKDNNGPIFTNGKLQAAWTGETITRAAEIIRYTYTPAAGTTAFDVTSFSSMLTNVVLPLTENGWTGCCSNWQTSAADATIKIGIFTDNATVYQKGVNNWRNQVPSAFYLTTDVPTWPQLAGSPIPPPGGDLDNANTTADRMKQRYYNATSYLDGLAQETCRDLGHVSMGLEAAAFGAESARIQGTDLFGEQKTRLTKTLEYNASLANSLDAGNPRPTNSVCPDKVNDKGETLPGIIAGGQAYHLGWEAGYNAYANRLGASLPETKALISRIRPTNPNTGLHIDWQTLLYGAGL